MSDKRCPNCKRWNLDTELICDCGFNFSTGTVSEVPASDRSNISTSWRVGTLILGVALIPGFIVSAGLLNKLGQLSPILVALLLAILIIPPVYWLLYFTCLEKTWARYLMLLTGLSGMVLTGFITASFVLRFINPQ